MTDLAAAVDRAKAAILEACGATWPAYSFELVDVPRAGGLWVRVVVTVTPAMRVNFAVRATVVDGNGVESTRHVHDLTADVATFRGVIAERAAA